MGGHQMCKATSSGHTHGNSIYKKARSHVKLEDLPNDVMCTILSKLPPKEISRASVLSSHWRSIRDISCNKLCFTGAAGCCRDSFSRKEYCEYMQKFIDDVNAVLRNFHGKVVDEFHVKFEFDIMLATRLNNWVDFAVSSQTKSIAVYLRPVNKAVLDIFRYIFPFHLLDTESISRLERIQLSFVSFRPPSEFNGFPNLRKLDLEFVDITRKDLQVILSNCCYLKWLSLVRCFLDDELKSDCPLSHLRHLTLIRCRVTRIELRVLKLDTFQYDGPILPIVINQDSKLENADICFSMTNFQDAISALLNAISSIQNLTLQIFNPRLETPSVLNSKCLFSHLKCLQLLMGITAEDANKLPNVVSILRVTPFIEKLEIHFTVGGHLCFADKGTLGNQHLQQREYKYLKSTHMTGYKGARGQHELLLHAVENAPALEALTVETTLRLDEDHYARIFCRKKRCSERAALHATSCLSAKLSPKVKLCVM